ncbi:hypothetical protein KEJ47_07565 [Candidatus Bathyarchaeota archaeon]|nr:hypothetical protein [Candidatus Bathyarchaeota archaeon]
MEKSIIYFEEKGAVNTDSTISAALKRAKELGIRHIVVASTHGNTGLKVAKAFKNLSDNIVAVSICEGYKEEGWTMTEAEKRRLREAGVQVLTSMHALGDGVASSFTEKFGGKSIEEVVQQTLYRFCQGMKVCVEIVLMAADAGMIPVDEEVMAIAGTSEGADTCIVVKPAYSRKFLELEIREIVAKPRNLS